MHQDNIVTPLLYAAKIVFQSTQNLLQSVPDERKRDGF
jgi:hypothetical protein